MLRYLVLRGLKSNFEIGGPVKYPVGSVSRSSVQASRFHSKANDLSHSARSASAFLRQLEDEVVLRFIPPYRCTESQNRQFSRGHGGLTSPTVLPPFLCDFSFHIFVILSLRCSACSRSLRRS